MSERLTRNRLNEILALVKTFDAAMLRTQLEAEWCQKNDAKLPGVEYGYHYRALKEASRQADDAERQFEAALRDLLDYAERQFTAADRQRDAGEGGAT